MAESRRDFTNKVSRLAKQLDELLENRKIGELISIFRKEAGMSQGELARLSGIPQETISRIENSKHNPTIEILEKLIQPLSCDLVVVPFLKGEKQI